MRLLLLFVFLYCLAEGGVFQTSLSRRTSTRTRLIRAGVWREYVARKNLERARAKFGIRGGFPQKINDYDDNEYVANISIGTPLQTFQVVVDTGTANTWVADETCSEGGDCADDCEMEVICPILCDMTCCQEPKRNIFDASPVKSAQCAGKSAFISSASKTWHRDGREWELQKDPWSVRGVLGLDTVTIGDASSPLSIPSVTFGQATFLSSFFSNEPVDGVLGLAFQSVAIHFVKPVFQEAIDQKLVAQPMFTVWLEREGREENVAGGSITWGGLDTTNCGGVIGYQSLSVASYWKFTMKSMTFGQFSSDEGWEVISDSGSSLIAGPNDLVERIASEAGATFNGDWQMYSIDCSAIIPDLTIVIGSMLLKVTKSNLIIPAPKGGPSDCVLAVQATESFGFGPDWILADPFVRQYCNIYDVGSKRIGFAPSLQK